MDIGNLTRNIVKRLVNYREDVEEKLGSDGWEEIRKDLSILVNYRLSTIDGSSLGLEGTNIAEDIATILDVYHGCTVVSEEIRPEDWNSHLEHLIKLAEKKWEEEYAQFHK